MIRKIHHAWNYINIYKYYTHAIHCPDGDNITKKMSIIMHLLVCYMTPIYFYCEAILVNLKQTCAWNNPCHN